VDSWLPARLRALTDLVHAESRLYAAVVQVLDRWASRLRRAVFGSGPPDPLAISGTAAWFTSQVDNVIEVEVREIVDWAARDAGDPEPAANAHVLSYLAGSRNRLVGIPDRVYADVRAATMKATTEGWSIDDLTARMEGILAESGAERWRTRARTIARTEALGAYNSGRFAGFVSLAQQLGGPFEKVWLSTDDARTRPTHVAADLQRVPLLHPFKVGTSSGMYPGAPELPAEETIQCRCSTLLVRQGENVDLTDRQYKEGAR
jgi:uncharacterized protein with gpF-like domain